MRDARVYAECYRRLADRAEAVAKKMEARGMDPRPTRAIALALMIASRAYAGGDTPDPEPPRAMPSLGDEDPLTDPGRPEGPEAEPPVGPRWMEAPPLPPPDDGEPPPDDDPQPPPPEDAEN